MISFLNRGLGKVDEACGQQQIQARSLPLVIAIHVTLRKSLHLLMSLQSQNEEDRVFLEGRREEELKYWSQVDANKR